MEDQCTCMPAVAPAKAETAPRLLLITAWALIIVGIVVRTWHLGSWPALDGDEAMFGTMALRGAAGDWDNMSAIRFYHSLFYAYLLIPFVKLFGNTLLAIRLLPWIVNMFGIWAMYAAARRLFGYLPGLMAAGTFAILPMGVVVLGRLGWDASLTPGLLAVATWMCVVAFQDRNIPAAIAAGLALAVGTWVYAPALLAIPALIAGLAFSGIWRGHLRAIVIALTIACAFSFPAYRIVSGLFDTGSNDFTTLYSSAAALGSGGEWSTPWSLHLIGRNAIGMLDHWTGAVSAEFLLDNYLGLPVVFNVTVRTLAVTAWIVILLLVPQRGGRFGRFVVVYVFVVFAIGHIANPAFLNLGDKSRYIVATVPLLALIMAFITHSWGDIRWTGRLSSIIIVSAWLFVSGFVLINIGSSVVTDSRMFIATDGDPKLLAADFLKGRVNPETDLVVCGGWWTYWPIAYYSAEAFPMFSWELVYAELITPDLPTAASHVWYVELSGDKQFAHDGKQVARWVDAADPSRELSVWLVNDPQAVIDEQVAEYQRRSAATRARYKQ